MNFRSEVVKQERAGQVTQVMRVGGRLWVFSIHSLHEQDQLLGFQLEIIEDGGRGTSDSIRFRAGRGPTFATLLDEGARLS